jgi:DNA mismatch endonuclease (patch repair protein)
LRSRLHRRGLRFRVNVAPEPSLRRRADIVFPRARVAVFVDGCFWHGCPTHASWPVNNGDYWRTKIEGNRARDAETTRRLLSRGWAVVRVWEHEDPDAAADRVAAILAARASSEAPATMGRP